MSLKAKALYDFHSENKEEISILENEELIIFDEHPIDGWLQGENSRGQMGLFPASYVEVIRPDLCLTECSPSPAGFSGDQSCFLPTQCMPAGGQHSCEDDNSWDDWDDSLSVEEEGHPQQGANTNERSCGSPCSSPTVHHHLRPTERADRMCRSQKGSLVTRNLNRFSSFVRSGVEAFVLGDVLLTAKRAESYTIEMGPLGPQWKDSPEPFSCSIEDPTKHTKFRGIKTYISYRLTPSHTGRPVYRRYKQFDWLYARLLQKFTIISLPHLPEKQSAGRFEDDFIEKRQRRLALWMDHMTSHPVLSQYEGFQHFLQCTEHRQWKLGKRRAERDEMVGAHFLLTLQIPNESLDFRKVEERIGIFKNFAKGMDESIMQSAHVMSELVRKHVGDFRAFGKVKESQRMSKEGKMAWEEADGVQKRCQTVGFALQAEMNHFHRRRVVDFKKMMQAYLREQIAFYQRVGWQLESTLHMYDHF
ncbi:sorting nexin-33-like isoform X2 [Brienomyrus brachyistius]|uniref:sorting nexin-33-like isoform X2 n=1 Tax=Brienomyrus brachyistius TaxID=42636 RepID=UPI0020B1C14D|nr:sorting nexin-33-like isoform X2 [Brienomyrus brachyistius]